MEEIQALEQALACTPQNIPLRVLLGKKLMDGEFLERAETIYRSGLKLAPGDVTLLEALAECYSLQGKHSAVLEATEDLAEADEHPRALYLRAKALFYLERVEQARKVFQQAMARDSLLASDELATILGAALEIEGTDDGDDREIVREMERPNLDFSGVGGMKSVKEAIRMKIIYPLKNAELFKTYGKSIGGGVLLYGPPGCGKTMLARATAGEIRSKFYAIGLHDILDMWLGESEKRLHTIFEVARRSKPCVLFFDEVDALAASRGDMRNSASRHVINQFLSELDGLTTNEGVLVLAATNCPWYVDSAFRRPGRFDRMIFVPPPDESAREEIWKIHLAGKPQEDIDVRKLASACRGFSGADIRAAVDIAVEQVLAHAMKTGKKLLLNTKLLLGAVKEVIPSSAEWFTTAKSYVTYANEGGVYDEIRAYLEGRQ